MKTARKSLLVALCALLLVVASVMGTLAYLTSTPGAVTNTFSVGSITITLDELDVDNSTEGENDRDYANAYQLFPGREYTKDPTVHVKMNSEDSWIFVKVVNGISAIEDPSNTIASQITAKGWKELDAVKNPGVYYQGYTKDTTKDVDLVVFEKFKIASTVTDLSDYDDANIEITAYAIQKAELSTASDAWTALQGELAAKQPSTDA